MRLTSAALLATASCLASLGTAGTAVADSNQNEQKPVMLCNIVLASPGAQVGNGCQALQVSNQSLVKQGSISHELIDYVGVRPTALL